MVEYEENIQRLEVALEEIETSIDGTEAVSRSFRNEIETMSRSMSDASRQASGLSKSVGSSLKSAFDDLIMDGGKLSDVMGKLGTSIANKTLGKAINPVTNALGGMVESGVHSLVSGLLPFKDGGVVSSGRVRAFANGGIVDRATTFPMQNGVGLMGEAGPEAILPLSRGADGKLGVRSASGGSVVNITMNISTPDAESFKKSKSQIAAQVSRALAQGNRNM